MPRIGLLVILPSRKGAGLHRPGALSLDIDEAAIAEPRMAGDQWLGQTPLAGISSQHSVQTSAGLRTVALRENPLRPS